MADTSGIAAIDGYTGPGRRTLLFQNGVREINFDLKRRVIGVVTNDGNYGSYDLVQVKSIHITGDGGDLMLSVTSKETENDGPNSNEIPDGTKPGSTGSGGKAETGHPEAAKGTSGTTSAKTGDVRSR